MEIFYLLKHIKQYLLLLILPSLIICQTSKSELETLYFSKMYDDVITKAKEILVNNPSDIEANVFLGESLVKKKEYESALVYLDKGISLEKDNLARKLWATFHKGAALYLLDRYSDAQKSISECYKLNSTTYGMREVEKFSKYVGFPEVYKDWEIIESKHFRFYFPSNTNVHNKQRFIDLYETAFEKINSFFHSQIPKRIELIVWNSESDAKDFGLPYLAFAKYEIVTVHTNKRHTIGHEIAHIISFYCSKKPKKMNKFISEGTAVYFDQTTESKLSRAINQKHKENYKQKINLKDVWKKPVTYPDWITFFLGSEVVGKLIENYGQEKFINFYHDQSYSSAKRIYGIELDNILVELEERINSE